MPVPAVRPLWCDAEQVQLTAEVVGVLGDDVGAGRGPSPVEARLGMVDAAAAVARDRGCGVGAGLDDRSAPRAARAMLELTYRGTAAVIPRRPPAE